MDAASAYTTGDSLTLTALALAIAFPLLSFIFSFMIPDKYSWVVSFIASFLVMLSTFSAATVFFRVWDGQPILLEWDWFAIGSQTIKASLLIDNLTVLMLLIVTLVSFLVHLYSTGYMAGDTDIRRYFAMLGFFTFSMLGIVVSGNLLLIFVFWELVGFSSYMLIGHWNEKPEAADAAKRAFIFNRVGDAGFIVGLMAIWTLHGTFSITELSRHSSDLPMASLAAFGIFCGVIGKSAQFPLYAWLPSAMQGPTPVSALIHAATMVAAGVFLLARVFFLLTPFMLIIITIIGCLTAIAGALAALVQFDIKRILAYSTVSQLGLMVTAIGAGSPSAAMLHLTTHAFFKACLFLCAGAVIHSLHQAGHQSHSELDVQDIRNLGGLRKKLPITFVAFVISGASLSGIPFFSGYLSKEAILESLITWSGSAPSWKWLVVTAAFITSFITVVYTFKMIWSIFFGDPRSNIITHTVEAPTVMRAPLFLLAAASVWVIVSFDPLHYAGWLQHGLQRVTPSHSYLLPALSAIWVLVAVFTAFQLRNRSFSSKLLHEAFYLDKAIEFIIERPSFQLSSMMIQFDKKWIDGTLHTAAYCQLIIAHFTGWVDRTLVDGITKVTADFVKEVGGFTRSFQKGNVQHYIFWAAFGIIIFIIWTLL
ncbi:MAG: NADH-quinone oxidoreductase subunit L [Chryseolinea sp.]